MKKEYSGDYLSDEELRQLIQDTEAKELISAPSYLEERVLEGVARERKFLQQRKNRKVSHRLFTYSLEVVIATAAAVAVMIVLPGVSNGTGGMGDSYVTEQMKEQRERPVREEKDQKESWLIDGINSITGNICNSINEKTSLLVQKEDK